MTLLTMERKPCFIKIQSVKDGALFNPVWTWHLLGGEGGEYSSYIILNAL